MNLSEYARIQVHAGRLACERGDFQTARKIIDHLYSEGSDSDRSFLNDMLNETRARRIGGEH